MVASRQIRASPASVLNRLPTQAGASLTGAAVVHETSHWRTLVGFGSPVAEAEALRNLTWLGQPACYRCNVKVENEY